MRRSVPPDNANVSQPEAGFSRQIHANKPQPTLLRTGQNRQKNQATALYRSRGGQQGQGRRSSVGKTRKNCGAGAFLSWSFRGYIGMRGEPASEKPHICSTASIVCCTRQSCPKHYGETARPPGGPVQERRGIFRAYRSHSWRPGNQD